MKSVLSYNMNDLWVAVWTNCERLRCFCLLRLLDTILLLLCFQDCQTLLPKWWWMVRDSVTPRTPWGTHWTPSGTSTMTCECTQQKDTKHHNLRVHTNRRDKTTPPKKNTTSTIRHKTTQNTCVDLCLCVCLCVWMWWSGIAKQGGFSCDSESFESPSHVDVDQVRWHTTHTTTSVCVCTVVSTVAKVVCFCERQSSVRQVGPKVS